MADDEEKTEEPTSKKLEDAKAEGNIAKSMEITGAAVLTIGTVYLMFFSSYSLNEIKKLMLFSYGFIGQELDGTVFYAMTSYVVFTLLKVLAPLFALVLIASIVSNLYQFGFIIIPLKFDLQKLDPLKGLKGIFSFKKLIEAIKLTFKLLLIVLVMALIFMLTHKQFLAMMNQETMTTISSMFQLSVYFLSTILLIIIIFAIIDYVFTRHYYMKSLRMSMQDIKDEFKNMEGDPHVKGRIRKIQMKMAQQRMMSSVPDADVVITNPTHYAVALKYDSKVNSAPKIVAKGIDFLALKIKDIAKDNSIPIIENPALARSLYDQIDIDREIPSEFYKAMAEIFSYVYELKRKKVKILKITLIIFLMINILYAKKDFYYSFIDSSGLQISEQKKQSITDGFDIIQNTRQLAKDGKIDEAYNQIKDFKEKNRVNVLVSDAMLLYSELALRKQTKRFIIDAANELETAINSSKINQYDLAKAYVILVELKLEINKIDDAKYFANIIIDNFDDELTKTYGKISLAKVYKYQKDYAKATKYLFEILSTTKDKTVATVVADELFDVYILDEKYDKANELITQILRTNIDFYANDSYLANKKVNRLVKAGMPEHASEILKELLKRTTKEDVIEDFKFKLANIYMSMYDRTNYYLEKAKELYKDVINDNPQSIYAKDSKMFMDEILMRQGFLSPTVVSTKYQDIEAMQQKSLLQELMNNKNDKKYELIFKTEKVYSKISTDIIKRFGYQSISEIYDEINIDLIRDYLSKGKCVELNQVLQTSRNETFIKLVEDETMKYAFFECLVEYPFERVYNQMKDTFNKTRDGNIYLYLEKMAFNLGLIDDALDFSTKVEMVDDKKVLASEFLYRYQILKQKDNDVALGKFFSYTSMNPSFIKANESNPLIIDFYHDYYFELLKNNDKTLANEILGRLYTKQKDVRAFVYSPFVEIELAKAYKEANNKQKAIDTFLEALKNSRKIKPNDEVEIYYNILNLYDSLGNKNKKDEYILKCKDVKNSVDSMYKKMCDEM